MAGPGAAPDVPPAPVPLAAPDEAALDVAALDVAAPGEALGEGRLPAGRAAPLTPAQPVSPATNTASTPATRVKPGRARRRIIRNSRSLGTRPPM
jgi:hypothetical protein